MKDSEFIELLNLYLDHEITAGDAARLEAEVQSNPTRRHVYQDYCRMQKACKILASDFAEDNADAAERKVVAFTSEHSTGSRNVSRYVVGTLAAAAACVAVVFVGRTHNQAGTPGDASTATTLASTPIESPAQAVAVNPAAVVPARHGIQRQNLNSISLGTPDANSLALTAVQNDPHFTWLQDVRLAPIQSPIPVDQVRFDATATTNADSRTYSSNKPLPNDVHWDRISFRFQK